MMTHGFAAAAGVLAGEGATAEALPALASALPSLASRLLSSLHACVLDSTSDSNKPDGGMGRDLTCQRIAALVQCCGLPEAFWGGPGGGRTAAVAGLFAFFTSEGCPALVRPEGLREAAGAFADALVRASPHAAAPDAPTRAGISSSVASLASLAAKAAPEEERPAAGERGGGEDASEGTLCERVRRGGNVRGTKTRNNGGAGAVGPPRRAGRRHAPPMGAGSRRRSHRSRDHAPGGGRIQECT